MKKAREFAPAYPESQCYSVAVNDIGDGYEYPEFRDLHAWCRFVLFLTLGVWNWKCPARQSVVAGDVFCLRLPLA